MEYFQWYTLIPLLAILQFCAALPLGKRVAAAARQSEAFDSSELDDYDLNDEYDEYDSNDDKEIKNRYVKKDNNNALGNADDDYDDKYYNEYDYDDDDLDDVNDLTLGISAQNDKNDDLGNDDEYNDNSIEFDYSVPVASYVYDE